MAVVMASDEGVDGEEVQIININASRYKADIRMSASDYIDSFFHDKAMFDGTPLTREFLHSDENISLVVNTRMARGIDLFYEILADEFEVDQDEREITFLMFVHRECAHRKIPKQYASGIAALYLRYCAVLPRKMRASA